MPELPEVEVTRRGIEPFVAGRRVERVDVRTAMLRWPVPAGLAEQLRAREVLVPILAPSLAGVALLGLTLSYDEFSRSVLVMGTGNTLPLELFAMTTNITTPAIYALGTVTTLFSLAVLLAGGGAIALLRKHRIGP